MHGDSKIRKVRSTRGKLYAYLSITLDYTTKGEVNIDMQKYIKKTTDEFTINIKIPDNDKPGNQNLFRVNGSNPLNTNKAGIFHTEVYRGYYYGKEQDQAFMPLLRVYALEWNIPDTYEIYIGKPGIVSYIKGRQKCLKWYVDAALAVHSDFILYTGTTLKTGKGATVSVSQKKLNTKISTEVYLVGSYDASSIIFWTKLFLVSQGKKV